MWHLFGLNGSTEEDWTFLISKLEHFDTMEFSPIHKVILGLSSLDLREVLDISISEINSPDVLGRTPMWWAVLRNDHSYVHILIEYGANMENSDSEGVTPIMLAAEYGDYDMIQLLLDNNAAIQGCTRNGGIIWHWARNVELPQEEAALVLDSLISRGADLNQVSFDGETALHAVSYVGGSEKTSLLVERGADINAQDEFGYTPLMFTMGGGRSAMAACLIKFGARVDLKNSYEGTILHTAIRTGFIGPWKVLREAALCGLLKEVDVHAKDNDGHYFYQCFTFCRDNFYYRGREDINVGFPQFKKLVKAVMGKEWTSQFFKDEDYIQYYPDYDGEASESDSDSGSEFEWFDDPESAFPNGSEQCKHYHVS
jgi:ankyrin repeat protein